MAEKIFLALYDNNDPYRSEKEDEKNESKKLDRYKVQTITLQQTLTQVLKLVETWQTFVTKL